MSQKQKDLKRTLGIGFVAAFGLITMSSSITNNSLTTMNTHSNYDEVLNYSIVDKTMCSSSMLSRQAFGDIVSIEKKAEFIQQYEKINVNLQITKIAKHISSFDFEDEFEEI